jgi:hypothetical protein
LNTRPHPYQRCDLPKRILGNRVLRTEHHTESGSLRGAMLVYGVLVVRHFKPLQVLAVRLMAQPRLRVAVTPPFPPPPRPQTPWHGRDCSPSRYGHNAHRITGHCATSPGWNPEHSRQRRRIASKRETPAGKAAISSRIMARFFARLASASVGSTERGGATFAVRINEISDEHIVRATRPRSKAAPSWADQLGTQGHA